MPSSSFLCSITSSMWNSLIVLCKSFFPTKCSYFMLSSSNTDSLMSSRIWFRGCKTIFTTKYERIFTAFGRETGTYSEKHPTQHWTWLSSCFINNVFQSFSIIFFTRNSSCLKKSLFTCYIINHFRVNIMQQ